MQIKSFQLKAPSRERADHQNHKPLSTNERVHRRACRENVRRRAASCSRTAWSLLSHRNHHLLQIRKLQAADKRERVFRVCSESVVFKLLLQDGARTYYKAVCRECTFIFLCARGVFSFISKPSPVSEPFFTSLHFEEGTVALAALHQPGEGQPL